MDQEEKEVWTEATYNEREPRGEPEEFEVALLEMLKRQNAVGISYLLTTMPVARNGVMTATCHIDGKIVTYRASVTDWRLIKVEPQEKRADQN